MHGPRLFRRVHLLALAALMLLPACSQRQPIPSDPPEVRTEASVRGARKGPPQEEQRAPKPSPVTNDPSDVVVAQATDQEPSAALVKKQAPAKVQPAPEAKPTDAKPTDAKPSETKQPEANLANAKAAEPKPEEAKTADDAKAAAAPQEAKAPDAKLTENAKPEPSAAAKADAAAQAAKSAPEAGPQAPRVPLVQIASFTTEKNAEAAVAWLKEKGYAQTRVVRVEQGGTTFHRVQAGPFQDPAAAREALEKLKADWPQAFIPAD